MSGVRWMSAVCVFTVVFGSTPAQPLASPPPAAESALRLPDGTIVVYTKSPEDVRPLPEGVLLPAAEYKALQAQVAAARAAVAAAKPVPPSSCEIRGTIGGDGDRLRASLTLTYQVRTTAPGQVVTLGTARSFPTAARLADGRLPLLLASDGGLSATLATAGDHTLSVDVVAPIGPRGPKGEPGFELGLPRAAITTLAIDLPAGVKSAQVGLPESGAVAGVSRWVSEDAARLRPDAGQRGYPLGPVDRLELSWETPAPANAPAPQTIRTAEVEVTVRVGVTQIETTVRAKLRGGGDQWQLALPATADIVTEPLATTAGGPTDGPMNALQGLTRPDDAGKPVWVFRPPNPLADWLVTAIVRQPRPAGETPGANGPFPIGPAAVPSAARVTGSVKVIAPPTVSVSLAKGSVELRRIDAAAGEATAKASGMGEGVVAEYRFASAQPLGAAPAGAAPLGELSVRPFPGFLRVEPTYTLTRVGGVWRLGLVAKVTPVREEATEVPLDLPGGWDGVQVTAAGDVIDRIDTTDLASGGKSLRVKLFAAQTAPFELTLTASRAGAGDTREAFGLPRFPACREGATRLTATVPEGFEAAGTVTLPDGSTAPLTAADAKRSDGPTRTLTVRAEAGVSRVELAQREYRPELAVESRAEVTWNERQAVVRQSLRFRRVPGDTRPVVLEGPAVDLRVLTPTPGVLEILGGESWQLRLPADASNEFVIDVSYSLPRPGGAGEAEPLPLLTARGASRLDGRVRVWGGTANRRVVGYDGPWRELPPEPSADRPALPWLTLSGTGAALPLALKSADGAGVLPGVVVERALVQTNVAGDGTASIRARFRLATWAGGGVDLELPPGEPPEVFVDGRRVDTVTLAPDGVTGTEGSRQFRLRLPEFSAGVSGLLLDVRMRSPQLRSGQGRLNFGVPHLPGAAYRGTVRQQWLLPAAVVPLVASASGVVEQHWETRDGLPTPTGLDDPAELEAWIGGVGQPTPGADGSEAVNVLQSRLEAVTVVAVPRVAWVGGCSLAVVLAGILAYRMRPVALGLTLTTLGIASAVAAVVRPQIATQVLYGVQPGVVALAAGYGLLVSVGWYYRRRVTHLPGFTRNPGSVSTTSHALDPAGSAPALIGSMPGGSSRRADLLPAGSTADRVLSESPS